jgi:hypothetical protein
VPRRILRATGRRYYFYGGARKPKMFKRLGHVIGWLGDVAGGLVLLVGVSNYFQLYERVIGKLSGNEHVYDPVVVALLNYLVSQNAQSVEQLNNDQHTALHWAENAVRQSEIEKLLLMVGIAIAAILAGRALRYVIAGRDSGLV